MSETFNIMMYAHDTYGLGHIRRTMAIASNLIEDDVNILILTGSPIVGRFDFPEGIDFVRVPGMIKKTNQIYLPHSIKVDAEHAIRIRRNIISATARTFNPGLFIVDKAPLGLKREVLPTLKWFRKNRPGTKVVLGLRDIMDDAESTRREWRKKQFSEVLDSLYSEIWVYGEQKLYDPIAEYDIGDRLRNKMVFTGYIPRKVPEVRDVAELKRQMNFNPDEKVVVVTAGGGGDGFQVLDTFLDMSEANGGLPFKSVLIGGPFMPKNRSEELEHRARRQGIEFHSFFKGMERLLAMADLVVSMGGYNTICEVLSLGKPSLIIPRYTPRLEQLIRAQVLYKHGLLDYLKWNDLETQALREKILNLLDNPEPIVEKIRAFPMTGLTVIKERLKAFRGRES